MKLIKQSVTLSKNWKINRRFLSVLFVIFCITSLGSSNSISKGVNYNETYVNYYTDDTTKNKGIKTKNNDSLVVDSFKHISDNLDDEIKELKKEQKELKKITKKIK